MKTNHALARFFWPGVLLAFALGTLSATGASGNPPELMTYQGYLTDGNGVPLGDNAPKNYDVVFRIYDGQSGGTNLWTEQQTVTADKGYFSVLLGEGAMYGSESRPSLSTVFTNTANASDRFIEITVRGLGSPPADVVINPRLRFLTSPYAFLAHNAVSAGNLVNSGNSQIVSITGTNVGIDKLNPASALDVGGTVTATGLTINGTATLTNVNGSTTFNSDIGLTSTHAMEFGKNVSPKEANAGKIAYQAFGTHDALDIVGAGTNSTTRKVKIWAEGGLTVAGPITGIGTVPIGGIIMWSGTDVPTGWHLCDGGTATSGVKTPDLRNCFIVGSGTGSSYALKSTGGATTHTLSVDEMPSHTHDIYHITNSIHRPTNPDPDHYYIDQVQTATSSYTWTTKANGNGTAFSILPPYYALAYIMRTE